MARPTTCSVKIAERMAEHLRMGMTRNAACHLSNLAPGVFYQWLSRAKTGEQPYSEFADIIARAEAEAENIALMSVQRAATGAQGVEHDWRAAAWLLERRFGEAWAPKAEKLSVQVESGPRVTVALQSLTTEQLERLVGAEVPLIEAREVEPEEGE